MAGIPLNTFRTVTKVVPFRDLTNTSNPSSTYLAYTAPPGTSGVILYAQVANIDNVTHQVSFWHNRASLAPNDTFTELLKAAYVPINDALVLLGGKLVLETGDDVYIAGSSNTGSLKLTLSILESANQ